MSWYFKLALVWVVLLVLGWLALGFYLHPVLGAFSCLTLTMLAVIVFTDWGDLR